MCREELYNADVNTNVVGLITDCTGDCGGAGQCRHGRRGAGDGFSDLRRRLLQRGRKHQHGRCTGDFDAIARVHGSAAMCREELYNADVNTNVAGLITEWHACVRRHKCGNPISTNTLGESWTA